MKETEKNQIVANFFAGSESFMGAIGGNKNPRSIPLAKDMVLTLTVKPNTTIQNYIETGEFNGDTYGIVVFDDASVSISKLCRRGNGLKLKGATNNEMLVDLFGRAIQNGGTYSIKVTGFRTVVYNGTPAEYPMFEGGTVVPLETPVES